MATTIWRDVKCPFCGEHRLIAWCPTLLEWHCTVCARTWRVKLKATRSDSLTLKLAPPARLAAAVFRQAILDARNSNGRLRGQAESWLRESDASFAFWCHVGGSSAARVRVGVLRALEKAAGPRARRGRRRAPGHP
jgi:hypothetical protein